MGTDNSTISGTSTGEVEIKRYLYAEMERDERACFEERLFVDDELFFKTAGLENLLVDQYTCGSLGASDLVRFKSSLEKIPERRQKTANARSLSQYIIDERPQIDLTEQSDRVSFFRRLSGFFGFQNPALGYAMAALLAVLTVSTGVSIFQNQQKSAEVARLQQQTERQTELQKELETLRKKEADLQAAVDNEREISIDFADELERERTRRTEIERELEKLKTVRVPVETTPLIASVVLAPTGTRGGSGGGTPNVKIGPATKRLSIRLNLPDDVQKEDRLSVQLNQKNIAKNIAPRIAGIKKSISLTVPTINLTKGLNELSVTDIEGISVSRYNFNVLSK